MTNQESRPQIVTDEDWKARVKAENAALDQAVAHEARPGGSEANQETAATERAVEAKQSARRRRAARLPAGNLETLISMLATQAAMALGVLHLEGEKPEIDLEAATHFIDLLSALEEKTAGNLSSDETRLLARTLHDLRLGFVEASRSAGKA